MPIQSTTIPNEQIWQRWDIITPQLREELASEKNAEIVWQTCANEHLTDEKSRIVARIISWVLLGFLHPEDVANEIKLSTGIHPEIANKIAATLNTKVFAPLHDLLEDSYAPMGTHPEENARGPILMEEIKKPESFETTLEKLTPKKGDEAFFKESPVTLEGLDKLEEKKTEPKAPNPEKNAEPEIPAPPTPITTQETISEPPSAAAPFIIHEEPAAPTLPKIEIGKFSLDATPDEFRTIIPEETPIPRANIEIGGSGENTQTAKPKVSSEEPRIVHYGDLRTPVIPSTPETPLATFKEPAAPDVPPAPSPFDGAIWNPGADMPPSPEIPPSTNLGKKDEESKIKKEKGSFFGKLFRKKERLAPKDSAELPPVPPTDIFINMPPPPPDAHIEPSPSIEMPPPPSDEPPPPPPSN